MSTNIYRFLPLFFFFLSSLLALTLTWTLSIFLEAPGPGQPSSAPSCDEGSGGVHLKHLSRRVALCVSSGGEGQNEKQMSGRSVTNPSSLLSPLKSKVCGNRSNIRNHKHTFFFIKITEGTTKNIWTSFH